MKLLTQMYGYTNAWLFHFPSAKRIDKNSLMRNVDLSISGSEN